MILLLCKYDVRPPPSTHTIARTTREKNMHVDANSYSHMHACVYVCVCVCVCACVCVCVLHVHDACMHVLCIMYALMYSLGYIDTHYMYLWNKKQTTAKHIYYFYVFTHYHIFTHYHVSQRTKNRPPPRVHSYLHNTFIQ